MPIYDHKCKTCGEEFEELLPVDSDNPVCIKCGGETERLISPCGWHLQGEGWYNPHSPQKRARGGCPNKTGKKPT